jgi:hypothetical protein
MSWLRRRLKGWRTVAFGGVVALLGLLDALSAVDVTPLLTAWLPEGRVGAVLSGIGLVTVALRFLTTTAVGIEKAPAEPDLNMGEPHQ